MTESCPDVEKFQVWVTAHLRLFTLPQVYRYWSGELDALGENVADTVAQLVPLQASDAARRAWASSKAVRANLHYDTYHNVYLQLRGRKRFLLLPPNVLARVHLHPSLHPSYRQSQVRTST